MFELHEKTAVITGAGSGIGRAIALLFAKQGARLFLFDISESAANGVREELEALGVAAMPVVCDVAKAEQVAEAFRFVAEAGRGLDILVNNAGVAHIGSVLTTTETDFDRLYQVNVKSIFLCAKSAIALMKGMGGVILNMASIASLVGLEDRFAYSMTKGAVLSMTRSIATDCLSANIRCNCICPARIHTPFVDDMLRRNYPGQEQEMFTRLSNAQPIGRMGTPDEVAALALYLCSDEAAFVTGQAFPIDGGVLGAPRFEAAIRSST